MKSARYLVAVLSIVLLVALGMMVPPGAGTYAAPEAAGDLDDGFGIGGKAEFHPIDKIWASAATAALQPDGKVIVAGVGGQGLLLARFNTDGSLDGGFGGEGRTAAALGASIRSVGGIAVQTDGKIVAGLGIEIIEASGVPTLDFAVLRFNPNGSPDAGFGTAGRVDVDFSGGYESLQSLAIDGSGRIVVGGWVRHGERYQFGFARLNQTGSLDMSFGVEGRQVIAWPGARGGLGPELAIDGPGRIVAAGTLEYESGSRAVAVRLTAGGAPDTKFGENGVAQVEFASGAFYAGAIAVGADGRIALAGHLRPARGRGINLDFAVARLLDSGALDTSFGRGGKVVTDFFGDDDDARGVVVLPDGGIVAAGYGMQGGGQAMFAVAAYDAGGSLRPGFGEGGKVMTSLGPVNDVAHSLLRTADGRLVLAGGTLSPPEIIAEFAVVRYTPDGRLDPSFGGDGISGTPFIGRISARPADLIAQPDGKLLIGGSSAGAGNRHFMLARLNPDGSRDAAFGDNGQVITHFGADTDTGDALALLPDGKILLAGQSMSRDSGDADMLVARYDAGGRLDPSFGSGGRARAGFRIAGAQALAVAPDGKIVLAGSSLQGVDYMFALARFNADGSLDASFGDGGRLTTNFGPGRERAMAVAVQPDGRIIAAGISSEEAGFGQRDSMALARYNGDGSLDASLGLTGTIRLDLDARHAAANDLELLQDGRVLLAGSRQREGGPRDFVLARLRADGSLDQSFGAGGWSGAGFESEAAANDMALQPDGKIVLAGMARARCGEFCYVQAFGLARFNADGSLDSSFGTAGKTTTSFVEEPPVFTTDGFAATAVAIQPSGRIVAVGSSARDGVGPILLAGYRGDNAPPTSTPTATPAAPTPTTGPGCIFSDVCPRDYFFTPVSNLVARGAISGYGDNTFRPFNDTTRSQLAKVIVLARALEVSTPAKPTFNDVPAANPFFPYVETAAAHGIVAGYADGSFRPFNPVTRGQLSKVVVLAMGWTPINPATPSFGDVPRENPFYAYVETARAQGIVSGYADGSFRWSGSATRGQIAKIVHLAVAGAE